MDPTKFGSIRINPRCSNNCVFCRSKRLPLPTDLAASHIKTLNEETSHFIKEGFECIDISGSEPLRYSRIIEYLTGIRPKFKRITILDPGNMLADREFAKRFVETGVDQIIIPLYGSDAEHHDRAVGNPGAFDLVTQGIRNLQEFKKKTPKIELTTLFLKQNIENIPDLIRFIDRRFGLSLASIAVPFLPGDNPQIKFTDFGVNFTQIRKCLASIEPGSHKSRITIRYVPPCILEDDEYRCLENMVLFNSPYLYYLAPIKENEGVKTIVSDYREQIYAIHCKQCYLCKKGYCGGINRLYLETNKDFGYHPVSKEQFLKIQEKIVYQEVNKGAEKEYPNKEEVMRNGSAKKHL